MTSSLVGSEMCIRDSCSSIAWRLRINRDCKNTRGYSAGEEDLDLQNSSCLLYTSDAADDM
eukprot:9423707-Prorocentrum_lima.AAC.1